MTRRIFMVCKWCKVSTVHRYFKNAKSYTYPRTETWANCQKCGHFKVIK